MRYYCVEECKCTWGCFPLLYNRWQILFSITYVCNFVGWKLKKLERLWKQLLSCGCVCTCVMYIRTHVLTACSDTHEQTWSKGNRKTFVGHLHMCAFHDIEEHSNYSTLQTVIKACPTTQLPKCRQTLLSSLDRDLSSLSSGLPTWNDTKHKRNHNRMEQSLSGYWLLFLVT